MRTTTKTCRACGRSFPGADVFCPHDGSRLQTAVAGEPVTVDPLIGTTLDARYRVLRVLGEGGMGIVYQGEHALIERRVAIKVLRDDFCRRPDAVERFRREAKSASRIGHPNIVDVLDFGETAGGASYFVMEMLEGQDLADVLARTGALNPKRAVSIILQCCHALSAAHEKGIVHRDLKPENILLVERDDTKDFVKIVDFGVAKMSSLEWNLEPQEEARPKLTRTGVVFGTPEYMSPEQAGGLVPDHRVDIYALGITLYELLTGRVPFEGQSFMSVLSKHANKPVPLLHEVDPTLKVSEALESLVYCALRKERDERFQSMQEMAAALEDTPELTGREFRSSSAGGRTARMRAMSGLPTTEVGPLPGAFSGLGAPSRGGRSARVLALGVGLAAVAVAGAAAVYAANGEYPPRGGAVREAAQAMVEAPAPSAVVVEPSAGSGNPAVVPLGSAGAAANSATAAAAEPASDLAAPGVPGLDLVTVRVTTQPPGARVRIAGGADVCAKTPCAFETTRGVALTLQASRGTRQTTTVLKPLETTELYLVLEAKLDKSLAPQEPVTPSDGLKVPEMFRDVIR